MSERLLSALETGSQQQQQPPGQPRQQQLQTRPQSVTSNQPGVDLQSGYFGVDFPWVSSNRSKASITLLFACNEKKVSFWRRIFLVKTVPTVQWQESNAFHGRGRTGIRHVKCRVEGLSTQAEISFYLLSPCADVSFFCGRWEPPQTWGSCRSSWSPQSFRQETWFFLHPPTERLPLQT